METVRVVIWNLFHGRADPPAGRPLLHEFATTLAGWEWDVALLQEVPPWWPPLLARACDAEHRSALTSRNALLPLRRAIASRRPDLLKSNGGGCNAILVRPPLTIAGHARRRLRLRPERRVLHAVRVLLPPESRADAPAHLVELDGTWVGNVHGQLGRWEAAPEPDLRSSGSPTGGRVARRHRAGPREVTGLPGADLALSVARLEAWDAVVRGRPLPIAPLVLGGDLNLPAPDVTRHLPGDWCTVGGNGPDHVAGRGISGTATATRPPRGTLSDHAPLAVGVRRAEPRPPHDAARPSAPLREPGV